MVSSGHDWTGIDGVPGIRYPLLFGHAVEQHKQPDENDTLHDGRNRVPMGRVVHAFVIGLPATGA